MVISWFCLLLLDTSICGGVATTLGRNQEALRLPLPHSLRSQKARCSSDAELSLSSLQECRRGAAGRKGVKGLLLLGQEKVPRGFGLRTGDPGDTADGAGNQGEACQPSIDYWEEPGAT